MRLNPIIASPFPILQVSKLGHREMNRLAYSLMFDKCQSQDLKPRGCFLSQTSKQNKTKQGF